MAIAATNEDDVRVLYFSRSYGILALGSLLVLGGCAKQEQELLQNDAITEAVNAPTAETIAEPALTREPMVATNSVAAASDASLIATNDSIGEITSAAHSAEEEKPLPIIIKAPETNGVVAAAPVVKGINYPAQDIYERGLATLRDREAPKAGEKALGLFREAAEAGNPPAQHALGVCYLTGIGVEKSVEEALSWLNKSAAQGYTEAQFKLASLYMRGDAVRADEVKALEFARAAAEQGHAEAQYNLATLFAMGKGVTKDPAEAAKWFRKAAERGHATAQSNLGVLYASGEVLEKNMEEALRWWRKAAEQGQSSAQFNLAQALVEGKSVPKDLVEAYQWFHLAAENGDRDARRLRDNLGVELTSEEVAEALKRAREFKMQQHAKRREELEAAF